jgi:DNA-binding CsgD family transcriptional regulator/tetratricopeptide (TPR) repeat protein
LFDVAEELGGELLELCRAHASRDELFQALLRQVNQPGMLNVVVLEDLHWADESTIDLLRFFGRRLRSAAVLVIGTYRDDALTPGHPLRLALGELASQRSTRRIGLAPLSVQAVGRLAAGSGLELAELYRLTSGNPFYVTEVLQAGTGVVPPSARDAVLARVARLGADARQVLDVAALTGTRVEARLLAHAAGATVSTLDELLASGLLIGDGGGLRFRHEIARIAVEQAVADHHRPPIHARILAALYETGADDDATLAFHAEAAGEAKAAMDHAVRAAGRAVELASHREAAAQYERALRNSDGADPATLATLHDGLSDQYSLFDRFHDAKDANERALALWREAGDRLREGDTLRRLSATLWRLCRGPESDALIRDAVRTLEPLGPTPELARAVSSLAGTLWIEQDEAAALVMARRARELAVQIDFPMVVSDALNTEAGLAAARGQEWKATMAESLDVALANNIDNAAGRGYANLHINLVMALDFADAERYFAEGVAYCDDRGIATYSNCLRGGQVILLRLAGRWDEAAAIAEGLLDRVRSSLINRMNPAMELGLLRVRRGDEGAWELLDEGATSADGTGEQEYIVPAHLARAEAFWLDGDVATARREAETALDSGGGSYPFSRGTLAAWLRRLGSDRTVDGLIAAEFEAQLAGDWDRSARTFLAAGLPYEAALALIDAGTEASLREALDVLHELGATATAKVARQRMRDLGARSIPTGARAATRAHPLGLTRREHEVLDLICAGRTNAEIAAALVISAKTVDHHVSAVLAKLGAPSRTAAAAQARKLGLTVAATSN